MSRNTQNSDGNNLSLDNEFNFYTLTFYPINKNFLKSLKNLPEIWMSGCKDGSWCSFWFCWRHYGPQRIRTRLEENVSPSLS